MLTEKKRRILFYISMAVFAALAIPLIFYSIGYRTGGVFINASESGAKVSIGKKVKYTSILSGNALIKNLAPKSYRVKVEKEGFWPWEKTFVVKSQTVSSGNALLVPQNIPGRMLGTTTPEIKIKKPEFPGIKKYWLLNPGDFLILGEDKNFYVNKEKASKEFPPEALEMLKAAPSAIFTDGDRRLVFWDGRNIDSLWIGSADGMPQWQKEKEISVFTSPPGSKIRGAFEYPGWPDYLIAAYSNGIFALEMDSTGKQNIFPIYKGKMPEIITVESGKLILKDDGNFIEIELP